MVMARFLGNQTLKPTETIVAVLVLSLLLSVVVRRITIPSFNILASSGSPSREHPPMATDIFGVKIEKNPPESKLRELGVTTWPKWECGPKKFPWTFSATETMYLLEGKVKVYVDGHEGSFEIGAGDLVVFPNGMKVTWDVIEAVNKHYSLEK